MEILKYEEGDQASNHTGSTLVYDSEFFEEVDATVYEDIAGFLRLEDDS